MQYHIIEKIN